LEYWERGDSNEPDSGYYNIIAEIEFAMKGMSERGGPQATVLLAEDDENDEKLTIRALRRVVPHAEIIVARDGQDTIDRLLDEAQPNPDLVLLDLKMPKLNGIEVLKRLRNEAKTRHIVVVVLTSSDEPQDIHAAYDQYANSFLQKPVDFEEFIELVSNLGLYWLVENIPQRR
jgi:CheY-like chemotaxis protein